MALFSVSKMESVQASTMSVNCTGNWLALAGRVYIWMLDLHYRDHATSTSTTTTSDKTTTSAALTSCLLPMEKKCDTSIVQWHPTIDKRLAVVKNDSCEIYDWILEGSCRLKCTSKLGNHVRPVTSLDWSRHDENRLATTSMDKFHAICIWDLRTPGKPSIRFTSVSGASNFRWNPMSPHKFATSHDCDARIWDTRKENLPVQSIIHAHLAKVSDLDWNNDEDELLTTGNDCKIKLWNVNNIKTPLTEINTNAICQKARFTPFGSAIVTLPQSARPMDKDLNLLHVTSSKNNFVYKFSPVNEAFLDFAWMRSPLTGKYDLITWSRDHTLCRWAMDDSILQECGVQPLNTGDFLLQETDIKETILPVKDKTNQSAFTGSRESLRPKTTNIPEMGSSLNDNTNRLGHEYLHRGLERSNSLLGSALSIPDSFVGGESTSDFTRSFLEEEVNRLMKELSPSRALLTNNKGALQLQTLNSASRQCWFRLYSRVYPPSGWTLVLLCHFAFPIRYPQQPAKFNISVQTILCTLCPSHADTWCPTALPSSLATSHVKDIQESCSQIVRDCITKSHKANEGCLARCCKNLLQFLNTSRYCELLLHALNTTAPPGDVMSGGGGGNLPNFLLMYQRSSTRNYTSNMDMTIPYPRFSGATFAPNGQLVCYKLSSSVHRLLDFNGKAPRTISGSGASQKLFASTLSPTTTYPQNTFYPRSSGEESLFNDELKSSVDSVVDGGGGVGNGGGSGGNEHLKWNRNGFMAPPAVVIYQCDTNTILPVSQVLANHYKFDFKNTLQMSQYNADVAANHSRNDLVWFWHFVSEMSLQYHAMLKSKELNGQALQPQCMESLAEQLMNNWLTYFRQRGDIQHLSILSVLYRCFLRSQASHQVHRNSLKPPIVNSSQLRRSSLTETQLHTASSASSDSQSKLLPTDHNNSRQSQASLSVAAGGDLGGNQLSPLMNKSDGNDLQLFINSAPRPRSSSYSEVSEDGFTLINQQTLSKMKSKPMNKAKKMKDYSTAIMETKPIVLISDVDEEKVDLDSTVTNNNSNNEATNNNNNNNNNNNGTANKFALMRIYTRCYAEMLYAWGCFNQRAELLQNWDDNGSDSVFSVIPTRIALSHDFTASNSICEPNNAISRSNNRATINANHRVDENVTITKQCVRCQSPMSVMCGVCRQPIRGLMLICVLCNHAGHLNHYLDWFSKHAPCPHGCQCLCQLAT